ncbi:MAG: hypothetical protein AAF557_06025 [Pseudomonadota bacterium]
MAHDLKKLFGEIQKIDKSVKKDAGNLRKAKQIVSVLRKLSTTAKKAKSEAKANVS